jgi:hypothetical protein
VGVRRATPLDLPGVTHFVSELLRDDAAIIGCVLPSPLAGGAVAGWPRMLPSLFGMLGSARVYVEEQGGRMRSASLVYEATHRPEWVVIVLVGEPTPAGADGAFRLLSHVCAAAARRGVHRVFSSVADETRPRETFFQAGFYSYTRETWYVSSGARLPRAARDGNARQATSSDAHDLFRFYAATTPHAVQRAEQLSAPDFDIRGTAGAFEPPHLAGGNPLAMRRSVALVERVDERRIRSIAIGFRGIDRHPSVLKVRTADGDVDRARDLARAVARGLPDDRALAAPVRSYEEHVARGLLSDGFKESATAMLFVKELAVRIEEPALAPVVVR